MKNIKLTKKEINKNLIVSRRSGFGGFDYNAVVRGFRFETLTDRPTGELVESDDTGHITFVSIVNSKTMAVNAIYEWFVNYAPQEFD